MSENILFDGQFVVDDINCSKYDRVSRIKATSVSGGVGGPMQMILDINSELWKVEQGNNLNVQLALSLNLDGSKDDGKGYRDVGRGEQTLADEFDYVMYGKIYRFQESNGENM
jgi:DNA-directed RNA polymerases I, II, and III subunit RPABC3